MNIMSDAELQRMGQQFQQMLLTPAAEWNSRYGFHNGGPAEAIDRYRRKLEDEIAKATAAKAEARRPAEELGDYDA